MVLHLQTTWLGVFTDTALALRATRRSLRLEAEPFFLPLALFSCSGSNRSLLSFSLIGPLKPIQSHGRTTINGRTG